MSSGHNAERPLGQVSFKLIVTKSDGTTEAHDLGDKPLSIGRARDCDIHSEEPRISRRHCFVSVAGGRVSVLDGGSRNGTFVNGERVNQAWLKHGDVITIGSLGIALQISGSVPPVAPSLRETARETIVRETPSSVLMPPASAWTGTLTPPPPPPPPDGESPSLTILREKWPSAQLEVIYQLGALLARSVNVKNAAEAVTQLVLDMIPVDRVFVLLSPKELAVPEIVASGVSGPAVPDHPPSQTILDRTLASGQAVFSIDVPGDPSLAHFPSLVAMKTRIVLCSPLRHGDEVIGMLYADATTGPEAPTPRSLALYEWVADQAALALGRARFHADILAKHEVLRSQRDQLDAFSRELEQRVEERTSLINEQHAELARRLAELERLQVDKDFMARALVHDIKNLVGSIVPNLSFIGGVLPSDPEASQALDDAMEGANRIVSMAEDLLTISRMEDGSFRLSTAAIPVTEALAHVIRRHARRAEELGVELELGLVEPQLKVTADPVVLGRVLDNLIGNALRYAGKGGRVALSGKRPEHTVDIVVTDTGPGVAPHERERIFEEWYRSSGRSARHHGIGLYFCRLAAQAHGGSIHVEGSPGDNRFVVSFPGGWDDNDEDTTGLHEIAVLKKTRSTKR
jgi:signal transduction histidine kinase/pSer/pThr/pTyr-binding forkhead associated (FHA) protein